MQQMDLFTENNNDYLYGEIEKIRNSMDRRSRAIFSLLKDLEDQILQIQERKKENAVQ